MKDKRKVKFLVVCIIITIIFEIILYNKAYQEDKVYKENMKSFLTPISREIEARGFICKEDKNKLIENGELKFERTSENSNDGKIEISYDLKGKIKDINIILEYSTNSYSDDIFSDVYYVLSLVGIDLYEDKYIDALNILIETPAKSKYINDLISESEIYINENRYKFSLKTINDKIQFCLE